MHGACSRRGVSLWPLAAKGWERGEVVNACDAAAKETERERACCGRCCTAANGQDEG